MSKKYDLNCPSLHSLPKFASKTKSILVGNGQHVSVLFVIPVTWSQICYLHPGLRNL